MGRVIDGEFTVHGPDQPGPTATPPPPPPPGRRPRKRRRWPWALAIVAAVLTACIGVPVAILALPILRDTINAEHGEPSPNGAMYGFMLTLEAPTADGPRIAARYIVGDQRSAILARRADYIDAIEATNRAHPDLTGKLSIVSNDDQHTDVRYNGDDHATVTENWAAEFTFIPAKLGTTGYTSKPLQWTATAERQSDGWRLTSITMPSWCGTVHEDGTITDGYVRC